MRRSQMALAMTALALAWLVFFGVGPQRADLNASLVFVGSAGLCLWTFNARQRPPRVKSWPTAALWALPAYAAFQLIPWPQGILRLLSPSRALLTDSLSGVVAHLAPASISVRPAFALFSFFVLLAWLTVLNLIRDISWRSLETMPWVPVAPLAAIAVLQALAAMYQWLNGSANEPLTGSFADSEQLAAFLEMALPFLLVFGFVSLRRYQFRVPSAMRSALLAALSWLASLILLLVLLHNSSGVSLAALAASLFALVTLIIVPRLRTKQLRWCGAGIAGAVGFLALLFIAPPLDFAESLARLGPLDQTNSRLVTWTNAATLLGDYRWFGTGPGGFESTFPKFQGSSNLSAIATPGNDVLYLLITYGITGFGILLAAFAGILQQALQGCLYLRDEPRRLLAAAITASFVALSFRCCLESTLSVPSIAMASAWIAGLSQSSGTD